jgi:protein TonB
MPIQAEGYAGRNLRQRGRSGFHCRPPRHNRLRLAGLLSLLLHVALLACLLLWFRHPQSSGDASDAQGAVELVMLEQQGTGPTAAPPEPTPDAAAPAPPIQPTTPPVPVPDTETSEEPLPLPVPPVPPAPPASAPPRVPPAPSPPVQHAEEAPQINLGGTDSETNAIVIAGPHVVPASVDAKFHNREPAYPREAVRRAEQGAVILLVHVSRDGLPIGVDIALTSGFVLLDRAARDAVMDWHFLPAVQDGRTIPFDMKLRVVFQLE